MSIQSRQRKRSIPYSPLGRGFLTGTVQKTQDQSSNDFRRRIPHFLEANIEKKLTIIPIIQKGVDAHHATLAQVALAWLLAQGKDLIPIPGNKQVRYLEQNIVATDLHLTPDEINQLKDIQVFSERYPEIRKRFIKT